MEDATVHAQRNEKGVAARVLPGVIGVARVNRVQATTRDEECMRAAMLEVGEIDRIIPFQYPFQPERLWSLR